VKVAVESSLVSLRVSGVFAAGDLPGFVGALERLYPIDASIESDGALHLRRRVKL